MFTTLHVNEVQRGNPVLQCIRNVKWEFSKDIIPDYVTAQTCVLFVSVNYHTRQPTYITKRIAEVGKMYRLRILLILVDNENNPAVLQDLNKIAFRNDFTLILGWSNLECARYIETLKTYEGKSATSIQEKEETEYFPRVTKVLTNVRSVNKTDVITLLDVFGNFANVCQATEQKMILCPGMGEKKVKRLHQTLHEPFKKKSKTTSIATEDPSSSGSSSSSSGIGISFRSSVLPGSLPAVTTTTTSSTADADTSAEELARYEALEELYGVPKVV